MIALQVRQIIGMQFKRTEKIYLKYTQREREKERDRERELLLGSKIQLIQSAFSLI